MFGCVPGSHWKATPISVTTQRDYIMRIIEQLGQALADVVGLRQAGLEPQALIVIEYEAGKLLSIDLAELRNLSAGEAVEVLLESRLSVPGATDAEWWITLMILLEEAADLYRQQGEAENAHQLGQISCLALDQVPVGDESMVILQRLVVDHKPEIPSTSVQAVLELYYERLDAYSQAENGDSNGDPES